MTKNTQQTNSVTALFSVTTGNESINPFIFNLQDFASMSMEAVYMIDFLNRSFLFVSNRDFFLNGYTVEEVMKLGFNFFQKVIYSEDMPLLEHIHAAILQRICSIENSDKINYFSFAIRIKNEATGHIMVDHKLKPILIDGQLRYGFCLLASSILEKPEHLKAHYYSDIDFEEYISKGKKWQKKEIISLTQREKSVLILAKQGIPNLQIADKMNVTHQTVKNILTSIYKKLNVNTITQAIIYATNNHLIYVTKQEKSKHPEETSPAKKKRRPLTPEKHQRIQDALDNGQSIRSVAKQENVGEWTIRYAIDFSKKLIKYHNKCGN